MKIYNNGTIKTYFTKNIRKTTHNISWILTYVVNIFESTISLIWFFFWKRITLESIRIKQLWYIQYLGVEIWCRIKLKWLFRTMNWNNMSIRRNLMRMQFEWVPMSNTICVYLNLLVVLFCLQILSTNTHIESWEKRTRKSQSNGNHSQRMRVQWTFADNKKCVIC